MAVDVNTNVDLRSVQKRVMKAEKKALEKAAIQVAKKLEENVPVSGEEGISLKSTIVYSKPDRYGDVKVGFSKKGAWRAHFVEFGTIRQAPQNFIERTELQMRNEVMKIIQDTLREELGL